MDRGFHPKSFVADEALPPHRRDRHPRGCFHPAGGEPAGPPRPLALLRHGSVEAGLIHRQPALGRQHGGEVQRKAVGVVEAKRFAAGHFALSPLRHPLHDT